MSADKIVARRTRPEAQRGTPADLAVITHRKTGPEWWHCAGCLGSAITRAPGELPLGWLEIRAGVPGGDGSHSAPAQRRPLSADLSLVPWVTRAFFADIPNR